MIMIIMIMATAQVTVTVSESTAAGRRAIRERHVTNTTRGLVASERGSGPGPAESVTGRGGARRLRVASERYRNYRAGRGSESAGTMTSAAAGLRRRWSGPGMPGKERSPLLWPGTAAAAAAALPGGGRGRRLARGPVGQADDSEVH